MSLHQRHVIREKIAEILRAANTSAGERVFANRPVDGPGLQYPRIYIWVLDEESSPQDMSSGTYRRTLQIVVEGKVKAGSDAIDDELDNLSLEIETAMKADHRLQDTVVSSSLVRTELAMSGQGSPPVGLVGLQYEAEYTF